MMHQADISNGANGSFLNIQELLQPKPNVFTPVEEALFQSLLTQYMGTEPADDAWTITIDADERGISWVCEYSISGYNYCSEDEYSISLDLSAGSLSPEESQYQRIADADPLLNSFASEPYLSRLYTLVQSLFPHAAAVWAKDNGRYDDPRNQCRHVWADLEILFTDLYRTGKTIHLHYVDVTLSPF